MERKNHTFFWFFSEMILSAIAVIVIILNDKGDFNRVAVYVLLIINIFTIIKVWKNWYLFIVFLVITYSNYSICVANYLSSSFKNYFIGYAHTLIGVKGLNILLCFSLLLLLFTPVIEKRDPVKSAIIESNRYNPVIVFGISVVLILIWIYGFHRPDEVGERGSPSALYEYSLIFFIVSLYYSKKEKLLIGINLFLGAAFALQNFVFGGRITGVQVILVMALCLLIDKFDMKKLLPVGIVLFIIMSGIGQVRASILQEGLNFRAITKSLFSHYFALDTAYSAYFTSMTFLDELTQTSVSQRFYLFGKWVLSMFLGGSVKDSNLAYYTRQFFVHYNGGVLPFFAWFYLSFPGLVLLAFYLRFLFLKISTANCNNNGLIRCLAVYVCASTFRWYLYSPSQIFRGVMLLCLVYGFAYLVDEITKGNVLSIKKNRKQ